jgi:hypothetical protein
VIVESSEGRFEAHLTLRVAAGPGAVRCGGVPLRLRLERQLAHVQVRKIIVALSAVGVKDRFYLKVSDAAAREGGHFLRLGPIAIAAGEDKAIRVCAGFPAAEVICGVSRSAYHVEKA